MKGINNDFKNSMWSLVSGSLRSKGERTDILILTLQSVLMVASTRCYGITEEEDDDFD